MIACDRNRRAVTERPLAEQPKAAGDDLRPRDDLKVVPYVLGLGPSYSDGVLRTQIDT